MPVYDWIADALQQRESQHLLRSLGVRSGLQGRTIILNGKPLLNFGSNDYLGLAGDERLSRAAQECLPQVGWGTGASPLIQGRTTLHAELERQLAEFEACQSALTFSSGFAANLGAVACLVDKQDAVFSDALNHASLIDGCRLSGAAIHIYQHGDMTHLRSLLQRETAVRRRLIVTDSLFSMDGDFAPLAELEVIAREWNAMLLVDEAHATGVWGASGRGAVEHLQVVDELLIRVGTLSKALGSLGGFVVGSHSLVQWCANQARSYVFSTAAPAAACATAITALGIVRDEPQRRTNLQRQSEDLRKRLQAMGLSTGNSASQIMPIILGDAMQTLHVAQQLEMRGLFVPAIRPPSVPVGASRLRISLTAAHRDDDIAHLVDSLREILK
ncbi:MAG: 8-amino-7-oxononanoate synthase [Planctomycetota bacterium]|nr:8-amino-7-oxononanoate synthase [Planctomycetota bacterium]MDA1178512.1 8-amino-7-oxononanoate synthase [Planctomycetota bacterium]